jgi:hypothetical protein
VTLSKFVNKGIAAYMTQKGGVGKRKAQQKGDEDEGEEQQAAAGPKTSIYLTINGQLQRKGFRCVRQGVGAWHAGLVWRASEAAVLHARRPTAPAPQAAPLPALARAQEGRRLDRLQPPAAAQRPQRQRGWRQAAPGLDRAVPLGVARPG